MLVVKTCGRELLTSMPLSRINSAHRRKVVLRRCRRLLFYEMQAHRSLLFGMDRVSDLDRKKTLVNGSDSILLSFPPSAGGQTDQTKAKQSQRARFGNGRYFGAGDVHEVGTRIDPADPAHEIDRVARR